MRHVTTGSSMATMFVERCRRRAGTGNSGDDVIEPWFVLSRSAYQRVLDVALADMTSAEVLERACASSPARGGELLRLLSAGDDVAKQFSPQSKNDNTGNDSPVDERLTGGAVCDDVTGSPEVILVDSDGEHVSKCLPLSLVARLSPSAAADRTKRLSSTCQTRDTMTSSQQPLCLRVPAYHRRRHDDATLHAAGAKRRRAAETCRRRHAGTWPSPPRQNVDEESLDDDVSHWRRSTSRVNQHHSEPFGASPPAAAPQQRSTEQRRVEVPPPDFSDDRHCSSGEHKSLTRKRKSFRQPEAEIVSDGDGWAPIDKDILVSIVERLSVSCLEPSSSSSSSGVQTKGTSTSTCAASEFRQPLTLIATVTPPRRCSDAMFTTGSDVDVVLTKRAAVPTPPSLTSPRSAQRTSSSPSRGSAARRKSTFQRRVQVRDTWNVPRVAKRPPATVDPAAVQGTPPPPRMHVWAPLEKSVVLNVIDQILVDNDVDDGSATSSGADIQRRRSEPSSSSRRRWLQPPALRAITGNTSPPRRSPDTTEASRFKWKSNILLRMRNEQTIVATSSSGGRWLDLAPGAVAATGS